MQKFKFNINGKGYEAVVEEIERNTARVELNGKSYTVQVEKEEAIVSPKIAAVKSTSSAADFVDAPTQPISGNAGSIKSPLPGSVFKIKVQEGQAVKAGDVLMTIEAMKMENEIMAPSAGKVVAISTTQGATVNTGDVLISLG